MNTYISILRGINVGGIIIKMDALRKSLETLGFADVKSYIQSGNLFFKTNEASAEKLKEKISLKIQEDFGYSIQVLVLTKEQVKKVIEENPFEGSTESMHVTFLSSTPLPQVDLSQIHAKKQADEQFFLSENAFYLYCPSGYGKTNLHTNFLESKLKVKGTTRNWKTTNELLRIAEEMV